MDIKDIRVLIALEKHRHFSRAADACNISQPALSGRIRKLEETLGRPIVFRGHHFSGFTEDGEKILLWARRILTDYEALWQDLAESKEALTGHIRIGIIPSATPSISGIVYNLSKSYPRITIEIRSISSQQIQLGLDDFSLQAGITYLENEPLHNVRSLPLYDERYLLVGSSNMLGSVPENATWSHAAELPLCLLTEEMQNRRILDAAFAKAGFSPKATVVSNSIVNLISHVRQGGFATILPERQFSIFDLAGVVSRPISNPVISQKIGLVVPDRDPLLPSTQALWDTASNLTM